MIGSGLASETAALVAALAEPASRASAARVLAGHLGAEEMLLFVRDPEVGALLPAPGFPQTIRGGSVWRRLLGRCSEPGRHRAEVDLPPDARQAATAVSCGTAAAVLLGGAPSDERLSGFESLLPLLAAMLAAEQRIAIAAAESAVAREAADRAQTLAIALENARAEGAKLNAELREEHRRKDEFLAMLAHELRNPLAPLVTSVELLRRPNMSEPLRSHQLDVMRRQIAQLSRLVEDLLDVSRVSRGRIELRRQPVEMLEILADAIATVQPTIDSRRHRLELDLGADPLPLEADVVRLRQVFGNLLDNAAKYTSPGGRITLSARRVSSQAVVRIRDNGGGIDRQMLPRIFDLFTQAPTTLDRSQGGLGIGLTLVRALVELHGGRVEVYSDGPGHGSEFTVTLPLAQRASRAASDPSPVTTRATLAAEAPLSVLLVDDNRDAADSLAEVLRLMGHEVTVAYSSSDAVACAPGVAADLVMLDIGLPGMDGYALARALRPRFSDARFVALTGYGTDEHRRRAREAGFDTHVVKPLTVEMLDSLVADAQRAR